jgi:chloramphenicol-sensitive protein RarD
MTIMHGSPQSSVQTARAGAAFGLGAYAVWGVFPLFLRLLEGVAPLQIVAHRVIWSVVLLAGLATALGRWRSIGTVARNPRTLLTLAACAAFVGSNWLLYIWSVFHGHVLAASLGYFINPLANVLLGTVVLHERLRKLQSLAVALAAIGVAAMATSGGADLWIALWLALSFSLYGLMRKLVAADPLGGLLIETALLAPAALAWLLWIDASGQGAFGTARSTDLLLMACGIMTAVPLLMFGAAARRLRLSTLGLFQYIVPTLLFIQAVTLFGERVTPLHLFTFGCIWTGLLLYAFDSLRAASGAATVTPPE